MSVIKRGNGCRAWDKIFDLQCMDLFGVKASFERRNSSPWTISGCDLMGIVSCKMNYLQFLILSVLQLLYQQS